MIGPLLDCHAHVLPDAVVDRFPGGDSPRFVTAERRVLGRMLEAQAEAGVTHAIVSDSFYLETAAEELPDWSPADRAKVYNDGLVDLVAQHPGRLWGLGCLDPWAGEAAARELERIVDELGLLGALVNPGDGRRFLDDPAAEPLLAAAEQLDVPLFVHPSRDVPGNEQYEDFQLGLIVGRPAQTATCAARLIFSGTLERHPDLRLLLAHGGGSLLFAAGRLDATWAAYRAAGRWRGPDVLDQAPSNYLRRFHVDTNTWSTAALRLLLDRLGVDRLVFGSDQPPVWFPLQQSVATVDFLDLSPEDAATIRWGNAARLFGLELAIP